MSQQAHEAEAEAASLQTEDPEKPLTTATLLTPPMPCSKEMADAYFLDKSPSIILKRTEQKTER